MERSRSDRVHARIYGVRVWLLASVMGCTPAATPVTPHASTPRPYLKLIEPDNEWTLPIVASSGHYDQHSYVRDQHAAASVHCRITKLEHIGEAAVSHLQCDKPYDDLSITGTWVAQVNGLYHPLGPITQPDDLASLVDDDLLISDQPRERDHSHTTDTSTRTVEATTWKHDGWCVHDKTIAIGLEAHEAGDRRSFTLCFDSTGIVAASEYDTVTDGTWRSIQIGAGPPIDPDDPVHPSGCDDC